MSSFFKLENVLLTVFLDKDSVKTIAARWRPKPKPLHFDQKDSRLNIIKFEEEGQPWI